MHDSDRIFLRYSIDKLNQLSSRIHDCLGKLTYEQLWARSSEGQNSAGNLALHLAGNVRQWICAGVGGRPDVRVRQSEFTTSGEIQAAELWKGLEDALEDAFAILGTLDSSRLTETITVQKYNVTVLEAIYHVVEHFAGHTGQIIFVTRLLTGQGLGFYKHLSAEGTHSEKVP